MAYRNNIVKDLQRFTTDKNSVFVSPLTFETPTGFATPKTVICNGISVKHSVAFDNNSQPVKGKTARVTVSEGALLALAYPVRDINNKVSLIKHKVTFVDSANLTYIGQITETYPDESTGIIVCILGDFKT